MMRTNLLSFLCFIVLACLLGCAEPDQQTQNNVTIEEQTYGLNSVVLLTKDSTWVVFADYFKHPEQIERVEVPAGLSVEWSKEHGTAWLMGQMQDWVAPMKVVIGTITYVVPLKRPPTEKVKLTFAPDGREVTNVDFVGDINGWESGADSYTLEGDDQWVLERTLSPGGYAYRIEVDGEQQLDPSNPDSVPNGFGAYNSFLKVERSNAERIPRIRFDHMSKDNVHVSNSVNGAKWLALWQNQVISKGDQEDVFTIPEAATEMQRSYIRVWSYSDEGLSNELKIPLEYGKAITSTSALNREDFERNIMYFMMVDRFVNGDSNNDDPVEDERILPKANYYGGDLEGIRGTLASGYFRELGINTLWISPITQNPTGAYQEYPEPRRWFSGYHGYWPVSFKKVDHRLGSNAQLKTLVEESHAEDYGIILDYVCNHVHEEHPMIVAHPEWKTELQLPNGERNLRRWDEYRLTTWFDDFLPTLDFSIPEVTDVMSDSAVWWIDEFDFDGFRHDATKHIPESFWRTNTLKLKDLAEQKNRRYFQVGETFGSRELIQSYIGSGMMDGQFDFNLYFDAVTVFKDTTESMEKLRESLLATLAYHGSLHSMCNITGNHDLTRFISLAGKAVRDDEDQKEAGWQREIKVEDPVGYDKLKMLQTFIMTIPGIPVIFYGDEIGMPGANDPDNRRMMRFDDLSEHELGVKEHVSKITRVRSNHMALLFGDLEIVPSADDMLIYQRSYLDDKVLTVFNNSSEFRTIEVKFSASEMNHVNASVTLNPSEPGGLRIEIPPFSSDVIYTE